MAATVILNLEEINLSTSTDTFFTISALNRKARQDYYKAVVSVVNQTTEIHGSQTLEVVYQSKVIPSNDGYARIKYKGRSIESKYNLTLIIQ